jgi:hypothetical protein
MGKGDGMLIEAYLESIREVAKGLEYYYTKKEWMMCVVLSWRRFCGCEGALSIATKEFIGIGKSSISFHQPSTRAQPFRFSGTKHQNRMESTSHFSGFPPSNDIIISFIHSY